ncbi:MAG: YjiG family protein [bacterium]
MSDSQQDKMITDVFVEGARRGWNVSVKNMLPNVVMAFVIIHALEISGLLDIIGNILGPVMAIFGLPGEGAAVLAGAWLSMGGGAGVAASLFKSGALNGEHITILLPAIFLMGAQIQYAGRLLGTANVKSEHYGILFGICIFNALISLLVMNYLVLPFLG